MSDIIPEERANKLLQCVKGGVSLLIDGDCACALLGPNLQEGEAEFVPIAECEMGDGEDSAKRRAAVRALQRLNDRVYPEKRARLPYSTAHESVSYLWE